MINRFEGRELEALKEQQLVAHDGEIAKELKERGHLRSYAKGELLMRENASDNHVAFILSGRVVIEVRGKKVAERGVHQHVGEMSVVDPTAARSADVRAIEQTVTFEVAEPVFSSVASRHPDLWRRLAVELSSRLRERTRLMRTPNPEPVVFIGSTAEKIGIARALQAICTHDRFQVKTWADGDFRAGWTPIESLTASIDSIDFSLLVVTPDDATTWRQEIHATPRDNVIFELGLAYGALGRDRTFMVRERGADLRLPSDLHGVRALEFKSGHEDDLARRLEPVAFELRSIIKKFGVRVG